VSQIFVSHSRLDTDIIHWFSSIFGRTNVKAQYVEYENWMPPASAYIQNQITGSVALFVLLGPNMANLKHTLSWIGSETGLAAGTGREIWVFEHKAKPCEVTIPYTTHYHLYDFTPEHEEYIRRIICSYDNLPQLQAALGGAIGGALGGAILASDSKQPGAVIGGAMAGGVIAAAVANGQIAKPVGQMISCPYNDCRTVFTLHNTHKGGDHISCPVCRKVMYFTDDSPQIQ
jgi:outer membrane lipoprotein SlyB